MYIKICLFFASNKYFILKLEKNILVTHYPLKTLFVSYKETDYILISSACLELREIQRLGDVRKSGFLPVSFFPSVPSFLSSIPDVGKFLTKI